MAGIGGAEQERHHGDQVVRQTAATRRESAGSRHDTKRQRADMGRGQTTTR